MYQRGMGVNRRWRRRTRRRSGRVTDLNPEMVHVSETCDDGLPRLITHVETAPGAAADGDATPTIHHALAAKDLLPDMHIVDTGYLDAELRLASRHDYGVELFGPTRRDQRWQVRAKEGFGMAAFAIGWERQRATCPRGCESIQWDERTDVRGNASISIRFAKADCRPCPCDAQCTKAPRRSIAIRPRAQYEGQSARHQG
jgi:transposase